MKIDRWCLKIDKTNAKAMIASYLKEGKRLRQAIWCDVMEKPFPMLITLNRTPTRFPMSGLGEGLQPNEFSMPYRYVADLHSEYFVRNDMKLWERICTNGLFDVWDPYAPYLRFQESDSDPTKYRIFLLRIYEIYETFEEKDIRYVNSRIDHIKCDYLDVSEKKPVIDGEEFERITNLLKVSIRGFLR